MKIYQRWNIHHRLQHIGIVIGFLICVVSGLTIKYSDSGLAQAVNNFFGDGDATLYVHLVGASIILITCAYHLLYLACYAIRYRQVSWAMIPTLKDITDMVKTFTYSLGISKVKPKFDRYSYKEKFDYLAVFWGMFMIGGSGLVMWFPEVAASFMPRWLIDTWRVGHSDEAILAVVFIFTMHLFNAHFNPTFFPASWVWFDGKITEEMFAEEHPEEYKKLFGEEALTKTPFHRGKYEKNKKLIITELIIYGAVLVWFLYTFLPHGFM